MTEFEPQQPTGISRRTVTKAMAWAVPVIAVATPVPAFAASRGILDLSGGGCKLPGNSSVFKGYVFKLTARNTTAAPITVTITGVTLNDEPLGNISLIQLDGCVVQPGDSITIPANTTIGNLVILTENAASSSNGELAVTFTVTGLPGTQEATATVDFTNPLTPGGGSCSIFTDAQEDCILSQA